MPTFTLAQYAQTEKQMLRKGLYYGLARHGAILDLLQWKPTEGLSVTGVRFDNPIDPDWIALDGSISSKAADGHPIAFSVHQMGVHIDIPELLNIQTGDKLAKDAKTQGNLAIKGAALKVNDAFINGDHAVDANGFEGINKLVTSLASSQRIGSSEIDVSDGGDEAERYAVVDRIRRGMAAVDGGKPTAGFCNREFGLRFQDIALRLKLLGDHHNWMDNTFNATDPRKTFKTASTRPLFVFDDCPFYDLGLKADGSTEIIGSTYSEGGSSTATRVFFIKADEENVEGLMVEKPDIREIGLLEDKHNRRSRLIGTLGLASWGPESISKVQGIKL